MSKPENYSKNVFINCPFDDEYFELLRPLLFVIVYFDFNPRISLESSDSGFIRLEKIITLIKESQFAIHDLSRLQANSIDEYYRLNMPFELGIDYGLRKFDSTFEDKRSLILETKKYDYMKAISDINGFDIKNHDDNPVQLIGTIRAWFAETVGLRGLKASSKIYTDFIEFNKFIFIERMKKYYPEYNSTDAEKFANSEIEELTIPEFIDEVRDFKQRSVTQHYDRITPTS